MMSVMLFPGDSEDKALTKQVASELDIAMGNVQHHRFPDKESYLRITPSEFNNVTAVVICSLSQPDPKVLPLLFLMETLRDLGAKAVHLVAPYLSYMRQDKRFQPGEALTAKSFSKLLSCYIDSLITIEPHLHRYKTLDEIYSIPSQVLSVTDLFADWIKKHIRQPLLIGPDVESKQWVMGVAELLDAPFQVLSKIRRGDADVEIQSPDLLAYSEYTPVLIDDIVSSGATLLQSIQLLKKDHGVDPACVVVHPIFAGDVYKALRHATAQPIISCNTISHSSNQINVAPLISAAIKRTVMV